MKSVYKMGAGEKFSRVAALFGPVFLLGGAGVVTWICENWMRDHPGFTEKLPAGSFYIFPIVIGTVSGFMFFIFFILGINLIIAAALKLLKKGHYKN